MEYEELERLEPWGPWRDNWHSAMLLQLLHSVHRKPGTPAAKLKDFMYTDPQTAAEQQDAEMLARFEALRKK